MTIQQEKFLHWKKLTDGKFLKMLPCAQKIKDPHYQIKRLKNGNLELSCKVHDFENNCLMSFKKGQYWNDIRSAYEDLHCIDSECKCIIIVQKKIFYYKAIKL